MATATVRAMFENGVFRPLEKIVLPEHVEFEFEPRPVDAVSSSKGMEQVYEILSCRYTSAYALTSERLNED